ncbi:hypothetical protein G6F68_014133 [Rhizopus microsporus]|nr:hypothetical protein G6F68_014133 [Rhizopus microsporus]
MTAGLHFARAQRQPLAQFQAAPEHRQRAFTHQLGAGTGHRAFVGLRPAPVQRLGRHHVDDAVAEELQALVVRRTRTAMGQRLLEQGRIAEGMTDQGATLDEFTGHRFVSGPGKNQNCQPHRGCRSADDALRS